jgi:hypothetical protein
MPGLKPEVFPSMFMFYFISKYRITNSFATMFKERHAIFFYAYLPGIIDLFMQEILFGCLLGRQSAFLGAEFMNPNQLPFILIIVRSICLARVK